MKKQLLFLSLAAAALLAGCSKTEPEAPDNGDSRYSPHAIEFTSQVLGATIESSPQGQSQPQTRAAADPTQAMTLHLVRADETGKGTNTFGAYSTTPLSATRAAGTGAQALAFATKQYYLADEVKSRFTGWWPAAASYTGGVASWTIDGATDILTAAAQTGDLVTPLPDLVFNHALSQLQFWFYAADAATQADWGAITKIEIWAQPTACKYTPATGAATGAVTFDASPTTDFATTNLIAAALPTVKTQMCDPVMIAPQAAPTVVTLYIETSTGVKNVIHLTAATYLPGQAYKINLKFVRKQIEASATVGDWGTPIDVNVPVI